MESKKKARVILLYASEWVDEESARSFFQAYRKVLGRKWTKLQVREESDDLVKGSGDDGDFELRRKGTVVTSTEGLEPGIGNMR